ncbi:hypothetical protein CDAR_305061 [Caerostris darwini]|uniref:Uncharacterized protein n=1 Tax=Caerostris darwini TaxID=1538125 RepID=A0AAV4SWJ9_9ARAC|nr:hypothetical protein CDAR_305061 [Caerostris darwini]
MIWIFFIFTCVSRNEFVLDNLKKNSHWRNLLRSKYTFCKHFILLNSAFLVSAFTKPNLFIEEEDAIFDRCTHP